MNERLVTDERAARYERVMGQDGPGFTHELLYTRQRLIEALEVALNPQSGPIALAEASRLRLELRTKEGTKG